MMGVHRSTYYRWKRQVDRWGLEALNVRERRKPRMPNEIGPHLEQRIVAFSLAHPGFGPRRISAELGPGEVGRAPDLRARRLAGALPDGSQHAWAAPGADCPPPRPLRANALPAASGASHRRVCARSGRADGLLLHRPPLGQQRLGVAVHRDRRRLRLHLGRASHLRAQPPLPPLPSAASPPLPRARARRLEARHRDHRQRIGVRLRRLPQSRGGRRRPAATDQSRQTDLKRLRRARPAHDPRRVLASQLRPLSLVPKLTALRRDLDEFLHYYNTDRAHTGRHTQGRVPTDIVYGARKMRAAQ